MKFYAFTPEVDRGFTVVALALVSVALTGCSGEPSAGDIDKTVRSYMSESQTQIQKIAGSKSSLGEIHNVKKLECKSDTDISWRCDVELDMTQFGNHTREPASFRFVKSSDGWALSR